MLMNRQKQKTTNMAANISTTTLSFILKTQYILSIIDNCQLLLLVFYITNPKEYINKNKIDSDICFYIDLFGECI